MKCSELTLLIEEISSIVAAGQGQPLLVESLKRLLSCLPNKTVADLAKRLSAVPKDTVVSAEGFKFEQAIDVLECTKVLLQDFGKPAVSKDLALLLPALRLHARSNVEMLVSALESPAIAKKLKGKAHPEEVAAYNRRLEIVLGDDDGFNAECARLENDPAMSAADFVSLAKLFAMATVKTRPAALRKIISRHKNLTVGRAKKAATGGRVAG